MLLSKKASYLDASGNLVEPTEPNAYKFEAFIFDAFSIADNMSILRVKKRRRICSCKECNWC